MPDNAPELLKVRGLKVHFPIRTGGFLKGEYTPLKAVDGVDFDLRPGETLGIVGESGCGKSTLGRAILQLLEPTDGRVLWLGQDLCQMDKQDIRARRQEMQIVFQDPLASLNPRMTVGEIIGEPLRVFERGLSRDERDERIRDIMANVGLLPQMINRYPHEFSGGQCQRIGIARAMILNPKLVICDEPVSALDVSIQAQIVNLLMDLQKEFGLSLIFISHDLSVVRHISHRILVLYLGKVMEMAGRESLYDDPLHPYTRALIAAVPIPDPDVERGKGSVALEGELPSPLTPPSGCVFRTRCPLAAPRCAQETPELRELKPGHEAACHFAGA